MHFLGQNCTGIGLASVQLASSLQTDAFATKKVHGGAATPRVITLMDAHCVTTVASVKSGETSGSFDVPNFVPEG